MCDFGRLSVTCAQCDLRKQQPNLWQWAGVMFCDSVLHGTHVVTQC
jgi:hypothetical protein